MSSFSLRQQSYDVMSDFTDDEDRQLVQLALMFSRNNRQILWEKLTQLVKGTKKSKEALRQRLKTLKRTHGRKLEHFPAWFFKKEFLTELSPRRLQTSRRTSTKPKSSIRERNKQVKKSRYKRRGRVTSDPEAIRSPTTKPERASMPKMSPRCPKCTPAMKTEPLASLQLLASVASTTGHGEGMMNRRV